MKFNCGPTRWEKYQAKKRWHRWFAWHPVRIGETRDCRWFEIIWRRGDWQGYADYWEWEYRTTVPQASDL